MNSESNQVAGANRLAMLIIGKDFWSGFVFVLISLVFYFVIIPREVEGEIARGLAPSFFPKLAAAWIGFLGIILVIRAMCTKTADQPSEESKGLLRQGRKGAMYAILGSMLYVVVCSVVGYVISTMLFLISFSWILGERRWGIIVVATFVTTLGIFVLFGMVMSLRLPEGILLG